MLLPQVEQGAQLAKDLLFVVSPAFGGEGVMLVSGKASGKITAVVGIACARHANFISGVNLGNSAHGEQERKSQIQFFRSSVGFSHKARRIVIAEECNQQFRMRKEPIMLQNVFQQFGGGIAQNNLSQRVVQGKIEDRIYAVINTVCSLASNEIRCDHRIET